MSNLIEKECIKCDKPVMCEEDEMPYCAGCYKKLQEKIAKKFTFKKRSILNNSNAR